MPAAELVLQSRRIGGMAGSYREPMTIPRGSADHGLRNEGISVGYAGHHVERHDSVVAGSEGAH